MKTIILDFGSGNTCKNKKDYAKKMLDIFRKVDSGKYKIIIKWQLFQKAGDNIPLQKNIFKYAHQYANSLGYECTSSVFDISSLTYLLEFNIPFVKIATNPKYDSLMKCVPKGMWIYKSILHGLGYKNSAQRILYMNCIPKYPAEKKDYIDILEYNKGRPYYISDHTDNFDIFKKYNPEIYECHFKLKDSTGLDAGSFARTPKQLREIL